MRVVTDAESKPLLLKDYIHSDRAQLGVHITSFEDGTFVTITWLHTLMDAMGIATLFRAWQAVLEEREEDVPDFVGCDEDPTKQLGIQKTQETGESVLKPKKLGLLGIAGFILNFVWDIFWYPTDDGRMVVMPASYFSKIKAQALEDLESLPKEKITYDNASSGPDRKPFLSDGDILASWLLRLMARANTSIRDAPARTVAVLNIFCMRDLLRSTSPQLLKEGSYLHNCTTPIFSHFTSHDFFSMPLGHVAARIRSDLVVQSSRGQIEAWFGLAKAGGGPALFGDASMALCSLTNWSKAKLYETDFSSAILKDAGGQIESAGRGKPSCIHVFLGTPKGFSVRGSGSIIGRDGQGNWWMEDIMRREYVEEFTKLVREESMLA
jgi:hypothetical protein